MKSFFLILLINLTSIALYSQENLKKQEQIMTKVFNDWKGDLEQFDDVCMVGVRI